MFVVQKDFDDEKINLCNRKPHKHLVKCGFSTQICVHSIRKSKIVLPVYITISRSVQPQQIHFAYQFRQCEMEKGTSTQIDRHSTALKYITAPEMKRLIHRNRNSCGTHLMAIYPQTKNHMKALSNDFDFDIHGNIRLAQIH